MRGVQAVYRSIFFSVRGKTRTVRSCGYVGEPTKDGKYCFTRAGTHEVQITYCSCAGEFCNTASNQGPMNWFSLVVANVVTVLFGLSIENWIL